MSDFNDTGRRDLQRIKELEATIAEKDEALANMVAACEQYGLDDLGFTMNCAYNICKAALLEKN